MRKQAQRIARLKAQAKVRHRMPYIKETFSNLENYWKKPIFSRRIFLCVIDRLLLAAYDRKRGVGGGGESGAKSHDSQKAWSDWIFYLKKDSLS